MTFWKRQNGVSSSVVAKKSGGKDEYVQHKAFLKFYSMLLMMGSCCYIFVQIHRTYNTQSEC
jgi:hypothetical protein